MAPLADAWRALLVVGVLAVVPLLLMAATSFVKVSLVLSLLRNALGTQQAPSGLVITAVAVMLTAYVMAPVGLEMLEVAQPALERVDWQGQPLVGSSASAAAEALALASEPLQRFLRRNAGPREVALFVDLSRRLDADGQPTLGATDLVVAMPAFLLTELAEAFQIGFLVFLPFLIIDLVVANILLALGMHMMSPTAISLPFKLLLFVLVDGFVVLTQALVAGYR